LGRILNLKFVVIHVNLILGDLFVFELKDIREGETLSFTVPLQIGDGSPNNHPSRGSIDFVEMVLSPFNPLIEPIDNGSYVLQTLNGIPVPEDKRTILAQIRIERPEILLVESLKQFMNPGLHGQTHPFSEGNEGTRAYE
jgi:hypothetical protein